MHQGEHESKSRVRRKVVYFNLEDEDELILFEKATKMNNFSKWVKKCLINDGKNVIKEPIVEQPKIERKTRIEKDDFEDIMM